MVPSTYRKNMQYSSLDYLNFPKNEGGTIQLNDGRVMGYKEYQFYHQFTKKPKRQLRPVLLIPGLPGSRFFCHPNVIDSLIPDGDAYNDPSNSVSDPAISSHNRARVTLIVLERPGIGLSTFAKRTMLDFAEDVRELCIEKGITEFDLISYSAGGPFGLAVGKVLGKKDGSVRLRSLAVISSVAPYHTPGCTSRMPLKFKIAWYVIIFHGLVVVFVFCKPLVIETNKSLVLLSYSMLSKFGPYQHGLSSIHSCSSAFRWLTRHSPRILSIFVKLEARNSLRDPASSFRESLMEGPSSDVDICAAMPGIESMFIESALEMYTRG